MGVWQVSGVALLAAMLIPLLRELRAVSAVPVRLAATVLLCLAFSAAKPIMSPKPGPTLLKQAVMAEKLVTIPNGSKHNSRQPTANSAISAPTIKFFII